MQGFGMFTLHALLPVSAKCCQEKTVLCEDISRGRIECQTYACGSGQRRKADHLVLLQLFCPNLVGHRAGPRNEHSKARTPGPHPPLRVHGVHTVVRRRERPGVKPRR